MKYLSLPEADIEANQLRSVCKTRCDAPKRLLWMGDKGSIVCMEKVHDQPLLGLGVRGLEVP